MIKHFIDRSNVVHNGFYDYSKVNYINARTQIEIVCPIHGSFYQSPDSHMRGRGCRKCFSESFAKERSHSLEKFIKMAKNVHGEKYDYSKVNYISLTKKVEIICLEHGSFHQTPSSHIHKSANCPKCVLNNPKRIDTIEIFIEKSYSKHGNKYDYSKVKIRSNQKVEILCSIHGSFFQDRHLHTSGANCPKCSNIKTADSSRLTDAKFIENSQQIHGASYDYSQINYTGAHNKVEIGCPIHGSFFQTPDSHANQKTRCPSCAIIRSKVCIELEDFFISLGFQKGVDFLVNDRVAIAPYELDFYFPVLKLAIEFNGMFWHSDKFVSSTYHVKKTNLCESIGIHLIHLFENIWRDKKAIVLSRLTNVLGKNTKIIYAKKCELVEIEAMVAKNFYDDNHLQGGNFYNKTVGLKYDGVIVACMSFKTIDSGYELVRFANCVGISVVGSASKLLKAFRQKHNGKIVSYADRSWSSSSSNIYKKLNFKQTRVSPPNYFYVDKSGKSINKKSCQKSNLINKYPEFNISMTESEMTDKLGYLRIFNCGTITCVLE